MSKRAFVTGGTGFLGLNLIETLCAEGWEVYALHRPSSNLKYLSQFPVQLVQGAINEPNSLLQAMPEGVEAVFHVAGNTSLWRKGDEQQYQDNVIGTRHMVQAALARGAKRFIHTSSVSAFGNQDVRVSEKTASQALSSGISYCKTKYLAEEEVLKGVSQGLAAVILNPCQIVGRYDQASWAQLFKLTYRDKLPGIPPGGGSFCHAQAIVRAHINAVSKGKVGERYLLGGVEVSYKEFLNEICTLLERPPYKKATPALALRAVLAMSSLQSLLNPRKEPQLTPEKYAFLIRQTRVDDSKAHRELDYPYSELSVMVKDCLDWLRQENLL